MKKTSIASVIVWLVASSWGGQTGFAQDRLPEQLDLRQAVELALKQHPTLAVAEAQVEAIEGTRQQSATRPNPSFVFQTEGWRFWDQPTFDAWDDLDIFAYVVQPIERGGERQKRIELADQDATIAEIEQRAARWRIQQNVKRAYWRALLSQKELELRTGNREFSREITDFHQKRVAEGAMPESALIRVQIEEDRLRLAEENVAVEVDQSKLRLLQAMGWSDQSASFELVEQPIPDVPGGGDSLPQLLERARQTRPEVLLAQSKVERARRRESLAQAEGKQSWDLVFGYKRTAGYNTLLGGVSIPLPLFDKNAGNVLYFRTDVQRAEALLREQVVMVDGEVNLAMATLRRRFAILRGMEEGMLDRADESWEIARAAYQEGAIDLLRLLDAQRSSNEVHLLQNRTQIEFQLDLVQLENAVGQESPPVGLNSLKMEP